jgi:hypothetical protein
MRNHIAAVFGVLLAGMIGIPAATAAGMSSAITYLYE